jgi:cysteine desulfurase/selenocysteine lyase
VDDPASWRRDFPALGQTVHGHPLVYLDTGATALKPQAVIDAVVATYTRDAGSVHRGVHALAERATLAFDAARADVAAWLGVPADEVVLTHGTTDGLNGVAQGWARPRLGPGDAVVVTALEHHANLVPWQEVCAERGAALAVCPIDDAGAVDVGALAALLAGARGRVRVVAVTQLSNVTGTAPPIAAIAEAAHAAGAIVVVDGAQGIAHLPVGPGALGADFYAFSGHKLYGPTGVGVLWGRRDRLAELAPWRTGGEMVASVGYDRARFRDPPARFEAGTPDIAAVIGLGAAVRYLGAIDAGARLAHERDVHAHLVAALRAAPGVRVLAAPAHAVASFTVDDIHPHDLATVLDREGVAIRSGHHCAQPLHGRLGVGASARASLGLYSTRADVDALIAAIARAREVFR